MPRRQGEHFADIHGKIGSRMNDGKIASHSCIISSRFESELVIETMIARLACVKLEKTLHLKLNFHIGVGEYIILRG